jgi:EmrB/QacA subfamily drug resistance transporter
MHNAASKAPPQRTVWITLALGLSTFLTLFDVTAVVVAMPGIATSLNFSVSGMAWVIDAYSLAFTAALLVAGALADRYGRRRSMLCGNAVFLVASVACGMATSGAELLAARVVQGVGAAFMATGAIALVAGAFAQPDQRARAFGQLGVISGVAMALGPTLGGLLASSYGWRWIFYANVPFCMALAIAVPRLLGESRDPDGRPLDLWGMALVTFALALAIDALLRREAAWTLRLTCLVSSAIAALLFVVQQRRSARPLFDPRVFATRSMAGVAVLLTALQFGYWAVLVYLPLFLSVALQLNIDVAGMALLAATLPMLLVPLIGGRLVTRWGWRRLFATAFGVIAAGDGLLVIAAVSAGSALHIAVTVLGMFVIGVGAALANPQLSSVALALAPPAQAGMAAAAATVVRQSGFAISIAALGATLASTHTAAAFVLPFAFAATVAAVGMGAALALLPSRAG